jgi:hypothetical protein
VLLNGPVCKRGFDCRSVTPGADRKLLLRLATIAKALKPAQAAPKLAGHFKMLELAMTGMAAIQGGFVRS